MQWLLLLLCPLMMLFCMRGMHTGGKKDCHSNHSMHSNSSSDEIQSLQKQLKTLQDQNMKLADEVKSLKNQDRQNVISLTKTN
jgi:cell division protein FtsB